MNDKIYLPLGMCIVVPDESLKEDVIKALEEFALTLSDNDRKVVEKAIDRMKKEK
jgi:hypothetical protein